MSRRAWAFILVMIAVGNGWGLEVLMHADRGVVDLWTLVLLAIFATISQVYRAEGQNHHIAFFATPVFFFAGVLLLSAPQLVLLIVIPHLAEWLIARLVRGDVRHLSKWYIQPFNIAMYLTAVLVVQHVYTTLVAGNYLQMADNTVPAAIIAAAAYLTVNQLILGQVLVLARNISWKDSGVVKLSTLGPEFIMLCLGMVIARLWRTDPLLVLPALTPLVLMYRALQVPHLMHAAQIDSKTGLANAGHFKKRFEEEFERARRFERPLAVIMADLDLLRNINNTYGHLAGDAVLEGIGKIIRANVRDYDIAGRFGGEEFSLVLPETELSVAVAIAERIRTEVERATFTIPTIPQPIRATISLGIARFPEEGQNIPDLVHEADIAVYQAKYQGRNRVICASDVPHSLKLEKSSSADEAPTEYAAAFRPATEVAAPTQAAFTVPQPQVIPQPAPQVLPIQPIAPSETDRRMHSDGHPRHRLAFFQPSWFFVGLIIMLGLMAASVVQHVIAFDFVGVALLVGLAVLAEWMQINVYGEHSISVSMAMIVAAALVGGMPGLVLVSAGVIVANQLRRGRMFSEWYKALFNWSTHILAGLAPLSIAQLIKIQFDIQNLLVMMALIIIASAVYYIIETGLISIAIGLTRKSSVLATWRAQFSWLAPHYIVLGILGLFLSAAYLGLGAPGMLVFALPVLMQRYVQQQYVTQTNASVLELRRMNSELSLANHEVVEANHSIHELNSRLRTVNTELFRTVGQILDARDPYVAGHSAQVAHYAAAIATELGMSSERVELVYHAGLLHDLGKIALPEHILNKPSKLTLLEFEQMKRHPEIGAELLSSSPALHHIAPLIRHHHERWDGHGYPDQLAGEAIPLESRILAVCDTVEAMASDRPYRRAEPLAAIIAELRRCSGTQFEPQVVEAFIRLVEQSVDGFVVNSARAVQQRTGREMPAIAAERDFRREVASSWMLNKLQT